MMECMTRLDWRSYRHLDWEHIIEERQNKGYARAPVAFQEPFKRRGRIKLEPWN